MNIQSFDQIQETDDQIKSPSIYKKIDFVTTYCANISGKKIMDISANLDRHSVLEKLQKLLDNNIDMSINIEASIFEFSVTYTKSKGFDDNFVGCVYNDKSQDICANLDDNSSIKNTYLKLALLGNVVNPQKVAFLKPQEIFPDVWKKEIQRKEIKEFKKNNMSTTDIYKCSKCGERKTKIIQMQLRSPDEPMTTIVTCQVCYNVWKR